MRSSFLESPQVLVVEASAGSGKTYALAKRYVQLCLSLSGRRQALPVQSILAITFTNKAAWEMKSRILDFFKRIALQQLKPFEVDEILKPLGLDEKEASALGFKLMDDVIRQYHYFQVQTIDSFINILLVGCSFKIGLSAGFKIQRNSREYLQLSLDELLDAAHSDKQVRGLFEEFVRQYLFLENRSGWFPKEDLLAVITELFRQYNTYQKPLLVYPAGEDLYSRKKKIFALMRELKDCCPQETSKRFRDHLDEILSNDKEVFDVDDLASYWSKEDFPVNKGGQPAPKALELWRKLTQEICGICRQEARSMFNPYVALFDRLITCFGRLSRRDDVLFLEELNHKAALLFENGLVTVEELYFRLAARLEHYLVDEFQDTSLAQWRNLGSLVGEALSQGGSLFYVGDKKQAIYSFRGGESRLFDGLQKQLADFNVQTAGLQKNFRSCPEIIKFNNRVFSLDNLKGFLQRRREEASSKKRQEIDFSDADFEEIANTFAHAQQQPGKDLKGGVVRAYYLHGRTKQERAQEVRARLISLIKELQQRFALKDIAILTRGNEELEEITQWLLQEGIRASSERSSDIKNNPLVAEIMHLLVFLESRLDNNAFAQFCLGELMPQATGISGQALRDFLFDCAVKSRQEKEFLFYKEFQRVFPHVWGQFFEELSRQTGVYPLYELLCGIIRRFNCEKLFPQYQGFLMHLLELAKEQEKENGDLASFLEYYEGLEGEDRFVPMAQMDAVKILTVHKAKGLEFPVVLLPFLEMDIKAGSGGRDGSHAYILDIRQEGLSLIRLKESYRQFCPDLRERYEQEYKKAFLVELNSVYVALTRAIEELYIFVPARVANTVNPAKFLIPEDCLGLGTPSARPLTHEKSPAHHIIKSFVSDPWGALQEEFLQEQPVSATLARRGEFYHALLAHVERVNEKNIDDVLKKALDKTSSQFLPPGPAEGAILSDLLSFINRPDVRPFFYLTGTSHSRSPFSHFRSPFSHSRESGNPEIQIFCEKEFVNKYGDTRRIDRLIVLKDEVQVVDYKLSTGAQAGHQKQMEGYIEIVKQFYPKHKVSGHILYLTS